MSRRFVTHEWTNERRRGAHRGVVGSEVVDRSIGVRSIGRSVGFLDRCAVDRWVFSIGVRSIGGGRSIGVRSIGGGRSVDRSIDRSRPRVAVKRASRGISRARRRRARRRRARRGRDTVRRARAMKHKSGGTTVAVVRAGGGDEGGKSNATATGQASGLVRDDATTRARGWVKGRMRRAREYGCRTRARRGRGKENVTDDARCDSTSMRSRARVGCDIRGDSG